MYKVMHSTVFFRVGSGGAEASMDTNACACSGFLLLARNTSAHFFFDQPFLARNVLRVRRWCSVLQAFRL